MNKTPIKIKKLHPDAKIPIHATPESAGFDIYALKNTLLPAGTTTKVETGIVFEIPQENYVRIEDRSGLAIKGIHKVAGIIDSDYRGEICIVLRNTNSEDYKIEKHDRIAQGILTPINQADFKELKENEELSETERGEGGFHSTGKK